MQRHLIAAPTHGALRVVELLPAPRRWLARLLRRSGASLSLVARRLAGRTVRPVGPVCQLPTIEFHAVHSDAGAPEGALYVNGEFVGRIDVSRL